jgi:hypothetical protein
MRDPGTEIICFFLVGFIAGIMFCPLMARAHDHGPGSWINNQKLKDPVTFEDCCNLNDCAEEPSGNIEPVEAGFLIKSTGEVVARERVIWRSPGGWWRCRYIGPVWPKKPGHTRCLIGPPPST